ncbi:hypothetical protein MLD38_020039 [Melastoma candidum]|uniref:Uncharacterized protein n=1 Tax=Melastoma candidum TaxID=119954 RepID=A0ACB9QFF4_9MYRT|nr:hypothetical protein MLD38_020039 [Melastoma candidum]
MLNRLQNHTFFFGESILRAILYREVGYFNYACGFYCEANCEVPRYSLSVLLIAVHVNATPPPAPDYFSPSVVWSANRENLVSANAILELTDEGNLVLKDADKGSTVWSTGTSEEQVAGINLTEIGNLVLFDQKDGIVWQSFDHPTDTLLDGQKLMVGNKLVATPSDVNRTEQGQFSLTITIRGLDAVVVGSNHQLSYYSFPSELSGDSYLTIREGLLELLQNDSVAAEREKTVVFINGDAVTAHYFRMHPDGHLRAYGYDALGGSWKMGDMLPVQTCQYPTVCGRYGICSDGQCFCPPPRDGLTYFSPVNSQQPELGCSPVIPLTCEDLKGQSFLKIKNVTYFNFIVDIPRIDENGCRDACKRNCSCKAAFFRRDLNNSLGECFLPSELFSLINTKEASHGVYNTVFIKVQNHRDNAGSADKMPSRKTKKTFLQKTKRASLGVVIAFVLLISTALLSAWRNMRSNEETEEEYIEVVSGMPIRFSYADLKYITDDFSQKLGEGGFGAVFRGTLRNGTMVAVKRLDDSRHMNKSFHNEVGTIGSIHHFSLTDFRNRPSMSTVIKVLDGVADVKDDLVYDFTHPIFSRSEASVTVLSPSRLSSPR